jgi:quercetin dioxygenase-like cupin family protein
MVGKRWRDSRPVMRGTRIAVQHRHRRPRAHPPHKNPPTDIAKQDIDMIACGPPHLDTVHGRQYAQRGVRLYGLPMERETPVVWMPGGVRTEIHLASEDTGGAFCLLVDEPPVGWSLPPHRHSNTAETIHILEGDFLVEIDGDPSRLSAGETIHVPKGEIHSSANVGKQPGRRVVLFSPAGMERFFMEAGVPTADSEIDLPGALASAVRHGWEFMPGA